MLPRGILGEFDSTYIWSFLIRSPPRPLWQSQGEITEANDPLDPIYGWFTERVETPNLKEANRHSLWIG